MNSEENMNRFSMNVSPRDSCYLAFDRASVIRGNPALFFCVAERRGEILANGRTDHPERLPSALRRFFSQRRSRDFMPRIVIWEDPFNVLPFSGEDFTVSLRNLLCTELDRSPDTLPSPERALDLMQMRCMSRSHLRFDPCGGDPVAALLRMEAMRLREINSLRQRSYSFMMN